MLDYYLAVKAIKKLLDNLADQSEIERYTGHATISHICDEIEKILKDREVNLNSASEKISSLRLHAAQACALVDSIHPFEQHISQCHSSLATLEQMLDSLDIDLSYQ
ncbi:hypothetical protein [Desulfotalea psychrophila]|uniref:Uncharacterized protein n=1 Tax=Desulfotalea psychrophila (strain LSv54 / DSM 12343) TaxID=177439 RepID=Q6ANE5_DESPS|nr:hypothetical protein [Desulfotalea psychrophila]CAG36129.1 unknown protein [Desulfotalea psychrophila LSv54]